MYKIAYKRIIDIVFSVAGLCLFSPIFLLIAILLFFANKGKLFFLQERPGKNGEVFKIIKFKTMNDKKDSDGNLLHDAKRLTKTGIFLRKTSLDEIPQLINVVTGKMSLVGPRPLLPEYLPLYSNFQNKRHLVKPGITGWAQVNGRNAISWEEKFNYDVWYVNNISFSVDVKILLLTFKKVFFREGINSKGQVTTEAFKGNS